MKYVRIILSLMGIVVIAMIGIFYVEKITTPIIEAYQLEQANQAKYEVFPELSNLTTGLSGAEIEALLAPEEDLDLEGTGIDQVINLDNKGYIYTATFQGYQSKITYMMGISPEGNITGYKTLIQGDTPGLGAEIANPDYWKQFDGLPTEEVVAGNIDGISGATVTSVAWENSMTKVIEFHNVTYGGATAETPEEKLARLKQELLPEDLTLSEYSPSTASLDDTGITNVEVANDGTDDTHVVYTVEFVGFNTDDVIEYLIAFDLETNETIGFTIIYANDTPGYGLKITEEERWVQFADGKTTNQLLNGEFDGIAGATVTTNAWKASMQKVSQFHQVEFEGKEPQLTYEQKLEQYKTDLFTNGSTFEDVTDTKPSHIQIDAIYDVYDDSSTYLGTLYHVITIGASYSETTFIEYYLAVNVDNTFAGFRMLRDTETEGRADEFYGASYDDTFEGDAIDSAYTIDDVSGSTLTKNHIEVSISDIVDYHLNKYNVRQDPIEVSLTNLQAAYPSATSFNSIYLDYDFEASIGNVYEALDAGDAVIGYVYYGQFDGYGGTAWIALGVDTSNITQQIVVVSDSESWDNAQQYASYDGSAGTDFATSTWLSDFEGIDLTSYTLSTVDDVAGVSTTTGGLRPLIETI
ncbi:MAG: FMN-binding protein, partial [Candidatus Izimaplasma sp.]|nr:FMN-binding protein [Candidatus Izimaplasma bacterium]